MSTQEAVGAIYVRWDWRKPIAVGVFLVGVIWYLLGQSSYKPPEFDDHDCVLVPYIAQSITSGVMPPCIDDPILPREHVVTPPTAPDSALTHR